MTFCGSCCITQGTPTLVPTLNRLVEDNAAASERIFARKEKSRGVRERCML